MNEGALVLFTCSARGIPAPEITWFREGTPFNSDSDSRVTVNTPVITPPRPNDELYQVIRTLNLLDARDGDSGNYTCVANNSNMVQPTATFSFELFVRGEIMFHLFAYYIIYT